jgi:DNA-binding NarL/FixJ family response regulator
MEFSTGQSSFVFCGHRSIQSAHVKFILIWQLFFRMGRFMNNDCAVPSSRVRLFLADSKPIENQLLAGALRHHGFEVVSSDADPDSILSTLQSSSIDVILVSCSGGNSGPAEMATLRMLQTANPQVPKIALIETDDREIVVQAFRSGARGILCLAASSFQLLCECIRRVHGGDISASTQHLNYLLESICQIPAMRVLGAGGQNLLTYREEQVVALVADGLSNRDVAAELGLSEHTVKKYLFRIFDKLGISNRVELVLYAFHHGVPQASAWAATA